MRCNATVFVSHPAFEHLALINILSAQTPARMMEVNFFPHFCRRMQSSDSMVSLGSDAVHDDFDMIEMVAKANNIDVNAGRFLPGLEVRQCTLRSRPDDAAGGRPPRDPRSDILPSPREHFTWDHRMRSDQAEPHRHPVCSAQNQRRTLHAGSDGADVTMPPCRLSRPPSEMLSVDFVMAWLLDGSVPARKSNVLPVIQDGKKRAQEPKLKGGRTRQGAGSSNTWPANDSSKLLVGSCVKAIDRFFFPISWGISLFCSRDIRLQAAACGGRC